MQHLAAYSTFGVYSWSPPRYDDGHTSGECSCMKRITAVKYHFGSQAAIFPTVANLRFFDARNLFKVSTFTKNFPVSRGVWKDRAACIRQNTGTVLNPRRSKLNVRDVSYYKDALRKLKGKGPI
ncbi:hypothetical protein DICVIV_12379 [Dictyocaulus viviparus]|uniref:Uncharacterized protein n=1 Tax=Dictyocaulus viviparus TaxID=29172 RepID=A0A0D8XAN7_DICVI|nr:hypothetical protein DICVIV_12379 [Dictyocaulus viviparus]